MKSWVCRRAGERGDEANPTVAQKSKKNQRKRDAGRGEGVRSFATPLEHLRQPIAKQEEEGGYRRALVEGIRRWRLFMSQTISIGYRATGRWRRRKAARRSARKRINTESLAKASFSENTEDAAGRGQQQQEDTLTEVMEAGRRKQADGVREEGWPAEAEKQNGGGASKKKTRGQARGDGKIRAGRATRAIVVHEPCTL